MKKQIYGQDFRPWKPQSPAVNYATVFANVSYVLESRFNMNRRPENENVLELYTSAKDKENLKLPVKVCWACCVRTDVSVSFLDPNSHADRLWGHFKEIWGRCQCGMQHVAQREPLLPPCTTFVHTVCSGLKPKTELLTEAAFSRILQVQCTLNSIKSICDKVDCCKNLFPSGPNIL